MRAASLTTIALLAATVASPAEARPGRGGSFKARPSVSQERPPMRPTLDGAQASPAGRGLVPSGPGVIVMSRGRQGAQQAAQGAAPERGGRARPLVAQAALAGPAEAVSPAPPQPWCAAGQVVSGFCVIN